MRDVSRDGPTACQIVVFAPRAVESAIGKARLHPHLAAGDARGVAFQRLHDAVQAGADRLALEVAVTEAISAFGAIGGAKCEHTRSVRRAIELLRERLDGTVTLDALADHAGTDKFHLCRAFRAQVGLPPHAYLTRLRIMRAKELLAAGVEAERERAARRALRSEPAEPALPAHRRHDAGRIRTQRPIVGWALRRP